MTTSGACTYRDAYRSCTAGSVPPATSALLYGCDPSVHEIALPELERQILYMRFFCEVTHNRIALQLGLSQMRVSRLIIRTCAHLRDQVMAEAHDRRRAV